MGQHHTEFIKDAKTSLVSQILISSVDWSIASKYRVRFLKITTTSPRHVEAVCIAVPTRLHHAVG